MYVIRHGMQNIPTFQHPSDVSRSIDACGAGSSCSRAHAGDACAGSQAARQARRQALHLQAPPPGALQVLLQGGHTRRVLAVGGGHLGRAVGLKGRTRNRGTARARARARAGVGGDEWEWEWGGPIPQASSCALARSSVLRAPPRHPRPPCSPPGAQSAASTFRPGAVGWPAHAQSAG